MTDAQINHRKPAGTTACGPAAATMFKAAMPRGSRRLSPHPAQTARTEGYEGRAVRERQVGGRPLPL